MDLEKPGFRTLSNRTEEEEYFYKKDVQLVRAQRKRLDQRREEQRLEQEQALHWMRCPKCGTELKEQELGLVVVDVCECCGGLFFDKGELELVLKMNRKATFLDHLAGWLDRIFTPGFDLDRRKTGPRN